MARPPVDVRWLGRQPYAPVHDQMRALLQARIAGEVPDTLLLVEHEPVFTVGRHRDAAASLLATGEVPVVDVERGGNVTFHGPGQLTAYPICALPEGRRDLHRWLHGLEAVCTRTIARWGVEGRADPRNTGVWVDGQKIAAIGIACRRWVTWHGLAINVDVDLGYFRRIRPCGLAQDTVTRLADHCRPAPTVAEVGAAVAAEFRAWHHAEADQIAAPPGADPAPSQG